MPPTDAPADSPIDWNRFWNEADDDRRSSAATGQYGKADVLAQFFETVGVPDDLGSFGCGPAHAEFELAERFPDLAVYGYDVAPSVIEENRRRADAEGHTGVTFALDRLPALETDRSFDLVYCAGTLFYVAGIESAVRSLYDRVRPGGYLVFDYPNRLTPAAFRRVIDENPEHADWYRRRYALVLARENLLSYDRIHELLGTWPRSLYSRVDAGSATARAAPCVYVPK